MIPFRLLKDVWAYRGFIAENVKRDFHTRYLGAQFGWLWALFQPLAMLTVYTVIFSRVMKPSMPGHDSPWAYSIYLCAGVLAWGLFSELLGRAVGVFVSNANLLKKVSLPKLALPVSIVISSLINYLIVMAVFMAFLVLTGLFPGWVVVTAVPVVLLLMAFAIGLGILGGTLNVFYRDVEQTMGVVLQFWFWLTPVVYVTRALPEGLAHWLQLNPLWPIMRALQGIFLDGQVPEWQTLAWPLVLALALNYLAMRAFARLSGEIVDEL